MSNFPHYSNNDKNNNLTRSLCTFPTLQRIELVPAYLLLAESNLGLKRFKVAEEFLLYANWSVLKNPLCSNELKSQLHRNFGKLYSSQGRYDDALRQLANDVYHSALESGPEHIDTAGGYYYMADVFLQQGKVEQALALQDKVVDVW
jgi:tetratricopeptide (TPR) repeat protein